MVRDLFAKPTTYEAYTKNSGTEDEIPDSKDDKLKKAKSTKTSTKDKLDPEEKLDEPKEVSKEDKIS